MNICGIICEYNPFHNGHKFHIEETKSLGTDAVVCVLSSDFVQRGEPAILNKHYRAEMAINCGADLVLELPTPFSCATAERFARGAINILNALGVVSSLSFGCEDDFIKLCDVAELLDDELVDLKIKEHLKRGISYAAAREKAISDFAPECSEILKKPNNILAIEYLRALPDAIAPIAILRKGASHDSSEIDGSFASASLIRELILNKKYNEIKSLMPAAAFDILMRAIDSGACPVKFSDAAVLSHLKRLSAEDFKKVPDVSEGLEMRIFDAISSSRTIEELYSKIKTKRYALSRIRRIITNAYLGVSAEQSPCYIRVLALNDTGKKVLSLARKKATLPIITKPAAGKGIAAFENEVLYSELYSLLGANSLNEWKRTPIIL